MSLTAYTLTCAGDGKSLADWGFDQAQLTLGLCGQDTLVVSHAVEQGSYLTEPYRLAANSIATLETDAGRVFAGRVFPRREGYRLIYEIRGLGWHLEHTPIAQDLPFLTDGVFTLTEVGRYLLGQQNLHLTLEDIAAQVTAKGYPLAVDWGDLTPPEDTRPLEAERNIKAIQAIRNVFAFSPYLTWFADYSGPTVQLRVVSVLRAGHGFEIEGTPLPANTDTHTVPAIAMEPEPPPSLTPLYEQQLSRVDVYFSGWQPTVVTFSGGFPTVEPDPETPGAVSVLAWTLTPDSATAANGAYATETYDIPLTRGGYNGDGYDPDEAPIPGLATRLLAPRAQLWFPLSWTEMGVGCNFDRQLGQLYSTTGADPLYGAAQSLVCQLTHDLAHGTTRIQCGPPQETAGFLDPWLANKVRQIQSRSESTGYTAGFEPNDQTGSSSGGGDQLILGFAPNDGGAPIPTIFRVPGTSTTDGAVSRHVAASVKDGSTYVRKFFDLLGEGSDT